VGGFETIHVEREERVATLTLSRPERHNAFNLAMARELERAWGELERDPEVVCVVVTGAGERAFCTGMDVADVASGDAAETADLPRRDAPWSKLTAVQNRVWKPVITAVNGMCCGGGLHFVADSDLVLAAEHATFFDTHVKVGLVAGLEPVGLARRIPLEQVLRMAFLGGSERMDAAQALACGLVGEVLPAAQLLPRARELAAKIAQHSPTALARTKRAVWESLDRGLEEGLDHAWAIVQDHNVHPDLAEGSRAFVEKRAARWKPWTGE
jgi:enoyl-CoA hydratase/carnithine racemase